jgi:hypothetical protein
MSKILNSSCKNIEKHGSHVQPVLFILGEGHLHLVLTFLQSVRDKFPLVKIQQVEAAH